MPGAQTLCIVSSVFSSLHESLQGVLSQRLEWTDLREVQERAYTAVSSGNDVLVIAPTAGGKSEAALIPVMDDILKHGRSGIACLYLSPLKALINDQEGRFAEFCTPTSLTVTKWHGDVPKGDRSWKEGEPPHFLMITPESLEVLLQERTVLADLRNVRSIIIDELHAFVETDRGVQLKVLLDRMDGITGRKVQRIGLSATTGNPEEVLAWLSDKRHGAELVAVPAPPKEKQFSFLIEPDENRRIDALEGIVAGKKSLVFVNSRSVAEHLAQVLEGRIRNLHIHHSSLSPSTRKSAEDAFLSGDGACIICTSTLELGIDIGDLDVVVQVGPPDSVSSFLQRMGRSGRRGMAAYVAWILKNPCELLCSVAIIECAMDREVEDLWPPEQPWNVLLQQVFLYLHHTSRAGRGTLIKNLLSRPAFRGISRQALDRVIAHLIQEGYITTDGEMLMPGTGAERMFGRSNWKNLYSVISGEGEYRAVTPDGEVVGKLDARFVNSRAGEEVSLGGRTWSMVKSDEGHNLVVVVPSGASSARTFWTSAGESSLSSLVCRRIQQIRDRGGSVLPLRDEEQALLSPLLAKIPECGGKARLVIIESRRHDRRVVQISSPNGCRFNRILAILLQKRLGGNARARYNDFVIRITGLGKTDGREKAVSELLAVQAMDRVGIGRLLPLPPREGWKFACLLPDEVFREFVLAEQYRIGEFLETIAGFEVCAP
ncbi:DEAD/DEAH box helicase [Methanoregula sp.]|uniref:DEAD/DEAH box helicase n=1 Tax=Methanoregula sp. TaxID=2052170 RepID=UPI003C72BA08